MAGKYRLGYVFSILCVYMQTTLASEHWQIVVLPDTTYSAPNELPALVDLHTTISQGLTMPLTHADFEVLNLHYLGLPNCILEDCSTLSDHAIRQSARRSGKEVNLALLYQINAFKQRQPTSQKWYFSLSGRLLDLHSGVQQDAFTVENWVTSPVKNCIGNCLNEWLNKHLALLAQDLGKVLSEKLDALPRRFRYQMNLENFNSAELQKIDAYLKSIEGYESDTLLDDLQRTNQTMKQNNNRKYNYTSALTASELSAKLDKLSDLYSMQITSAYDNVQRKFKLTRAARTNSWNFLSQFVNDIIATSKSKTPPQKLSVESEIQLDEDEEAVREQIMWQQAQRIDTLNSYQHYRSIWPKGQHIILAEAAIQEFQEDQKIWQYALAENTRQAFQRYLALKPHGEYRNQAKQQLALLLARHQLRQKQKDNKALADDYFYQHQNYSEALYFYEQASKFGDAASQYLLGKMYEEGKGTEKNMRQAANWYLQSAKQGQVNAQATLGFLYSKGKGVNQDYSKAVNWYQKAAEQGHVNAQYNLAYLYSLGHGVEKDYQQAAYWYRLSATQGDADAQNSLGKLYERGLGVSKNILKAKSLYKQSASQGNQIARLNLQMLNH